MEDVQRQVRRALYVLLGLFTCFSFLSMLVGLHVHPDPNLVHLIPDRSVPLLVGGLLLSVTSMLGWVGVYRENIPLLKLFSLGVILLYGLYSLLGCSTFFLKPPKMSSTLKSSIMKYKDTPTTDLSFDYLQIKLECCGAESYKDWWSNPYYNCSALNPSIEKCGVPFSCCRKRQLFDLACGLNLVQGSFRDVESFVENINTVGCSHKIDERNTRNTFLVFSISLSIALSLICSLCLTFVLISQIYQIRKEFYLQNIINYPKIAEVETKKIPI